MTAQSKKIKKTSKKRIKRSRVRSTGNNNWQYTIHIGFLMTDTDKRFGTIHWLHCVNATTTLRTYRIYLRVHSRVFVLDREKHCINITVCREITFHAEIQAQEFQYDGLTLNFESLTLTLGKRTMRFGTDAEQWTSDKCHVIELVLREMSQPANERTNQPTKYQPTDKQTDYNSS